MIPDSNLRASVGARGAKINELKSRISDIDTLKSLIGEGVHTGLRKRSDAPQSATAWRAINEMPDKDWGYICQVVAETIRDWVLKGG